MSAPRGLSEDEAAAWARLAQSVTPMEGRQVPPLDNARSKQAPSAPQAAKTVVSGGGTLNARSSTSKSARGGLDGHWERRLQSGAISPDFALDLHGATLDTAHSRLMHGMDQARGMGARVVLLIAGKSRPVDPADRASSRGAIRAQILDWLAASPHADNISAVRRAHRRHGGEGALYLILRREGSK